MLCGGDKTGNKHFYESMIPIRRPVSAVLTLRSRNQEGSDISSLLGGVSGQRLATLTPPC